MLTRSDQLSLKQQNTEVDATGAKKRGRPKAKAKGRPSAKPKAKGSSKAKGKPPSKGADAKAPEALEASPKPCKASKDPKPSRANGRQVSKANGSKAESVEAKALEGEGLELSKGKGKRPKLGRGSQIAKGSVPASDEVNETLESGSDRSPVKTRRGPFKKRSVRGRRLQTADGKNTKRCRKSRRSKALKKPGRVGGKRGVVDTAPAFETKAKNSRKAGTPAAVADPCFDSKVPEAGEPGEVEDMEMDWPNTFAGRYLPKTANSKGWHLWRGIVKSFLLYINHEIQGRSRTKREVGWTGVSVFTWYKYHMQLISCFCMGYVLAPAQLEYWAFAKKAYMASSCESYGDFDDFFADQAEKYVEQTFACCEAWSTLWVSTNI